MDVYTTEEQQVEALKNWLRNNGISVAIGIGVGLTLVFGYRYWQQQQHLQRLTHSAQLEAVVQLQGSEQKEQIEQRTALLNQLADSKDGSYSVAARLAQAKTQVEAGKLDAAESLLQQALADKPDAGVQLIVQERLLRVLIAQNKLDQADKLLAEVKDPGQGFEAVFAELKGDVLRARQDWSGARKAYEQAVAASQNPPALLNMKLEQLPAAGAK